MQVIGSYIIFAISIIILYFVLDFLLSGPLTNNKEQNSDKKNSDFDITIWSGGIHHNHNSNHSN